MIVYSSTTPDTEMAGKIARAVESGAGLFAASSIIDPEIAALLPVRIVSRPEKGIPERRKIVFTGNNHPLENGGGWSDAAFGIYQDLEPKKESRVLLKFRDGGAAVVEGGFGRGRVIYSTFTLGADLIPGKTAHDAFLIRALGYLGNRSLPEASLPIQSPDKDCFLPGAHLENFGRFGHLLGDGLLTEQMTNNLLVCNGGAEYSFLDEGIPKIKIERWNFRLPNAAGTAENGMKLWNFKYAAIGQAELTAETIIPETWRGKPLFFSVADGIDDTAEVYFNGVAIGSITETTPMHWQAAHRHRIAPELIRFGKKNTIRIVTKNLRGDGGFNSCPELISDHVVPARKVRIDRINWIGKGGVVSSGDRKLFRFDTSLGFPGIRWEFFNPRTILACSNIADYAAYKDRNGKIQTLDLRQVEQIPVTWGAPYLLLFGRENPLLLVFAQAPGRIIVNRSGENVDSLEIISTAKDIPVGMIVPVWISGRRTEESQKWFPALPDPVVRSSDDLAALAFRYPLQVHEFFRIDRNEKRIEIRSVWKYKTTGNQWKIEAPFYAPVPPLAYLSDGLLFATSDPMEVTQVASGIGPFVLRRGSDTVNWSLPLPDENDGAPTIHVAGFDLIERYANKLYADGIRWAAGGRTKLADWSMEYPFGKNFPNMKNISFYAWMMGIPQSLAAPFGLDATNRAALEDRIRIRYYAPIERNQYKAAIRWREEPFSRICYPIYFNSYYPHRTCYQGTGGSLVDFGDQNEASMMILAIARRLADYQGQREFVRANWSFLKHAARIHLVSDDWGHMSCHCRESGGPASIDMLNCEYPAMLNLARCAAIAGDESLRDQALYRAARRAVATIGRYRMPDYVRKERLAISPEDIDAALGYTEEGSVFRRSPEVLGPHHLFDMSQGTAPELIRVTRQYAGTQIGKILDNQLALIQNGRYQPEHDQMEVIAMLCPQVTNNQLQEFMAKLMRNESFNN
ncbi:MAG: hypothetical protein PHS41_01310 [Victivallaceae bacterium]|nr:hypothetical protein [Victivallaceae bacterium]